MIVPDTVAIGYNYTRVVGGVTTGMAASGVFGSLVQLLVALVGAALIAAAVQGFKAEWRALFKKPFGGAPARILVYVVSGIFQLYNGYVNGIPTWEVIVLALLTALVATGIYHFVTKRQSA
jgi:succinate dehydrogenase hydrophobic anchor subunit